MKKIAFLLIAVLIVVSSCGNPGQFASRTQQKRVDIVLTDADLYKGNIVAAYLENETKFIKEANTFFLRGVDAYRNKKALDSANYYFIASIKKEPSAKAYFELGNVFMDTKAYASALKAYDLAEQLNYEPFSKILYNKSCIYSLQKEKELAGQYLEYAIQAGYNNIEHIQSDKDLAYLRETPYFQPAIDKGLRGMSEGENLFWLQFKKLFPAASGTIDLKPVLSQEIIQSLEYISYDYEKYISEMRDAKFSREVGSSYLFYSRPYETETYVAVVYIVKNEWIGDLAPLEYKMATFTHDGKLIDKRVIGGSLVLDEQVLLTKLKSDRTMVASIVEPQYEKDPGYHGYEDNKLKSYKKIGTMNMKITKAGKIVVTKTDMLASN